MAGTRLKSRVARSTRFVRLRVPFAPPRCQRDRTDTTVRSEQDRPIRSGESRIRACDKPDYACFSANGTRRALLHASLQVVSRAGGNPFFSFCRLHIPGISRLAYTTFTEQPRRGSEIIFSATSTATKRFSHLIRTQLEQGSRIVRSPTISSRLFAALTTQRRFFRRFRREKTSSKNGTIETKNYKTTKKKTKEGKETKRSVFGNVDYVPFPLLPAACVIIHPLAASW